MKKVLTNGIFIALAVFATAAFSLAAFDEKNGTIVNERWTSGTPLGGIGCGKIELLSDGRIARATINHNWDRPTGELKGAFFAVSARGGGKTAARMLRLKDDYEYKNVKNIAVTRYTGKVPFANMEFDDAGLPVTVKLEAFSGMVPYNAADSALPAAHFTVTVTNNSKEPQNVSALVSWPNILGFGGRHYVNWQSTAGNRQDYKKLAGLDALLFSTSQTYPNDRMNTVGQYLLGAKSAKDVRYSYAIDWDAAGGEVPFWEDFERVGILSRGQGRANTDEKAQPAAVAAQSAPLAPGESRKFEFILAWHMPHHITIQEKLKNTGKTKTSDKDVSNAIDGNPATKWSTSRRMLNGDALVADLGNILAMKKVILDVSSEPRTFPRSLRVEVSQDGDEWKTAVDYDMRAVALLEDLGTIEVPLDKIEARHIRIVQTSEEKFQPWSVGELKFYAVVKKDGGMKTIKVRPAKFFAELIVPESKVKREDVGHFYMNRFKNVEQAALYAMKNRERIRQESQWLNRVVERSSLPGWLKLKLVNTPFVLYTNGIYTKDGRFAVLESPSDMTGALGTMDQRMASHGFYTMFYPELDKAEMRLFAKCQRPDGRITHFNGNAHEIIGDPDVGYGITDWPDLSCSWTMQALKLYRWTGDRKFLAAMWPHMKRAMAWLEAADKDGDFIPEGGSTYDYEAPSPGAFSYTASAYLGALAAAAETARVMGDEKMRKHYTERLEQSRASVMKTLWNGEYFIKWNDPATGQKNENSFIAQLAGDWLARLSGLPRTLDAGVINKTAANILKIHVKPFDPVPPMEVAPDGTVATYRCFVMQHEPYIGMESIYEGFVDEGLDVIRRVYHITYFVNRDPWKQHLSVFAPEGKAEGLVDYMTAPATWHVFNALSGVTVDVSAGTLFVSPRASATMPELHIPVFLSRAWLWLDYVPRQEFKLRVIRQAGDAPVVIKQLRMDGDAPVIKLPRAFTMKLGREINLLSYEKQLAPFN